MESKRTQTLTNRKRSILGSVDGSDVAETEFINSISLKCAKTVKASIVKKLPDSNLKLMPVEDSFANAISPSIFCHSLRELMLITFSCSSSNCSMLWLDACFRNWKK